MMLLKIILTACFFASSLFAGWDIIDHKVQKDDSGIWSVHNELPIFLLGAVVGGALMEGNQSRIGRTLWQSLDSFALSEVITGTAKLSFGRKRPDDTDNPNDWFQGGTSMPSGHVSATTALVAPFIFEYANENPWMHLLWAIPVYEGIGRVKAQSHWQSDVIVGFGVGVGSALVARKYGPWVIRLIPGKGAYVGVSLNW